jgi:hypothetical protein
MGRAVGVTVACEGEGTEEGCTVAGNRALAGEAWQGGGVRNVVCSNGGCSRVSRNTILGRRSISTLPFNPMVPDCQSPACGRAVRGISGGRFIDHNFVEAGCSRSFTGISGGNRVLGNVVLGHDVQYCIQVAQNDPQPPTTSETGVTGGAYYDLNEIRVARTYDVETFGTFMAASLTGDVYEDNVFSVSFESDPVVVEGRTPRRFVRNHLVSWGALYYDIESARHLTTAAEVNDLSDMISFGNTD